jgi:hypothetical protein
VKLDSCRADFSFAGVASQEAFIDLAVSFSSLLAIQVDHFSQYQGSLCSLHAN